MAMPAMCPDPRAQSTSGSPLPHQPPAKSRVRISALSMRTFSTQPLSRAKMAMPRLVSLTMMLLTATFRTLLASCPIRIAAERDVRMQLATTMFSQTSSQSVMEVRAMQSSPAEIRLSVMITSFEAQQ